MGIDNEYGNAFTRIARCGVRRCYAPISDGMGDSVGQRSLHSGLASKDPSSKAVSSRTT